MQWLLNCLAVVVMVIGVGCSEDPSHLARNGSETDSARHISASQGDADLPVTGAGSEFIRQIDWIGRGSWLKADTHIHTTFSDGEHSVAQVAQKGVEFRCDVLAITDHADEPLGAATPESAEAILAARRQFPEVILIAGLEWNIPPYGGQEHATVLVPPGPDEWRTLTFFKARFDDWNREESDAAIADEGLRWLANQHSQSNDSAVMLLNHPSRKRGSTESIVTDLQRWRAINRMVVGMSGAPGHQAGGAVGAYKGVLQTVDRWDPAVANIGDAWDQLLQQGIDVWAALAPSDFHNIAPPSQQTGDYWPGQFSEIWLYVPERTASGALQALRAGTFFAAHGHIVRAVELRVNAPGLSRPASAGEVVNVRVGSTVVAELYMEVPGSDWQGQANRIDEVELIAITRSETRVVARQSPSENGPALVKRILVPPGGVTVRARGRRGDQESGTGGYYFYTNPIRIVADENGAGTRPGGRDR